MLGSNVLDDKTYRQKMGDAFKKIASAIDAVDPDLAEAETSQGVLTILCKGNKKVILSPQPPVKQIWLAVAAQGIAVHFDFDPKTGKWVDDKQMGYELYQFTEGVLEKTTGQKISLGNLALN